MTEIVCGSDQRRKLEGIPMSNNVVKSRIDDISENILKQVMEELATSPIPFSLQLDESTDVSYYSQLVCYVCYVNGNEIKEFLFANLFWKMRRLAMYFKR